MFEIPRSHPRYISLKRREKIIEGMKEGLVALEGLIAHGRGEAFDYLLGEKSTKWAVLAEKTATALMLVAKNPVISVNGNTAVLAGREIIKLAKLLGAKIEVNLFYRSENRVEKICRYLEELGATDVLGRNPDSQIAGLQHARALCTSVGIGSADVVLVALEDGDRTKALVGMGKSVIAIDLNPLSRTAREATVTIVDDVERAIANMCAFALNGRVVKNAQVLIQNFNNYDNLAAILRYVGYRLNTLYSESVQHVDV